MGKDVIIACDFSSAAEVYEFLEAFRGLERKPFLKIGMELFYAEGPQIVRTLKERGHRVFLDLKLHDIPNTVEKAMRVLARLDVDMCNVHAAGTKKMMEAALRGLTEGSGAKAGAAGSSARTADDSRSDDGSASGSGECGGPASNGNGCSGPVSSGNECSESASSGECGGSASSGECSGSAARPLLIAVTQLTSTSQEQMEQDLLIEHPMEEVVAAYAEHASEAGLDGVVCSPLESPAVHDHLGKKFLTVTPGVRLAGDAAGDQSRVTTPARARELGSDYIVVGRSITAAADPLGAYQRCMREFTGASAEVQ